jgi:hypothetical protein
MKVNRQTVDLSGYPDLVVIYLGMRVNTLIGIKTALGFGPKISNAVGAKPDGLLLHEQIIYSIFPMHVGMRQYWRDYGGRAPSRTCSGGNSSCAIQAAQASGTRPISCEVA